MKYVNNTKGVIYIPRDDHYPTITVKPGQEVSLSTGRAVKGLTLLHVPVEAKVKVEEVTKKPKKKKTKVNKNAIDNTDD